jgi:molecular chaperone GrpE
MKKARKKVKGKELEDLKNQLARALADYDNLRKRVEREKEGFEETANLKMVVKILPIFDMLVEVQRHLGDPGLAITIEEFKKFLREEGIVKIAAEPDGKFDEKLHEAVEVAKNGKGGKIVDVILTGWKFTEGPVIRPAKVKVTKKKEK